MAENSDKLGMTVYLEGHVGHRGNVLAHAYIAKVQRLILVFRKLERAYNVSGHRQTDFEIVGADKRNPTTLTLKPVPKSKAYDPSPAFYWSLQQLDAVARGVDPDPLVISDIADEFVKLASKESEYGYQAFWVNGHARAVKFDENFLVNAARVARERRVLESPTYWRTGVSVGSIVGELKKVDDLEVENEFVVVPPVGPAKVVCTFPEHLRSEIGEHLFKKVRVSGKLHYCADSPFPSKVEAETITTIPLPRKTIEQLKGVFALEERINNNWDGLLSDF